jgi:hypothetical protein
MNQVTASVRRKARRRAVAHRRSRTHAHHQRARYRLARYIDDSSGVGGRGSTLLALVHEIQKRVENDADVVRLVRWMVNSGAIVLTGTFAGQRF